MVPATPPRADGTTDVPRIQLGDRLIHRGRFDAPYIIAEAGVNHEGDMDNAIRLIKEAKHGGADAVKFQTYKASSLASRYSPSYWDTTEESTTSQHELFSKYDAFDESDYKELAKIAAKEGITFLSTAFDDEAVAWLDPLMPFHKVASADLTNHPLLTTIAERRKPMVLSTGAASKSEIFAALEHLDGLGVPTHDIALLHCVLNYPCDLANANIGMIRDLVQRFPDHVIGYSDHTRAHEADVAIPLAWQLGAQIIETHFTFDKTLPGNDHYHALDKDDLVALNDRIQRTLVAYGRDTKGYLPSEVPARLHARRSLVAARTIKAGETLTRDMIAVKRPGTGIAPSRFDEVIGGTALVDIDDDRPIQRDWVRLRSPDPIE